METLLNNLSKIKKDTIYFCIALRKKKKVDISDVKKVQKIIDKLEEKEIDFQVKEVKCITKMNETIGELKENGLSVEDVKFMPLGEKQSEKKMYVSDEAVAKNIGGYPLYSQDIENSMPQYIKKLQKSCVHSTSKEDGPCRECKESNCALREASAMKKIVYLRSDH